jgi:hypothetical protein
MKLPNSISFMHDIVEMVFWPLYCTILFDVGPPSLEIDGDLCYDVGNI